jgi:hypothetical protein
VSKPDGTLPLNYYYCYYFFRWKITDVGCFEDLPN